MRAAGIRLERRVRARRLLFAYQPATRRVVAAVAARRPPGSSAAARSAATHGRDDGAQRLRQRMRVSAAIISSASAGKITFFPAPTGPWRKKGRRRAVSCQGRHGHAAPEGLRGPNDARPAACRARRAAPRPLTGWHAAGPPSSLPREDAAEPLHAFERHAAAAHDAGQRVFGHQHRRAGLLGEQPVRSRSSSMAPPVSIMPRSAMSAPSSAASARTSS